MILSLKINFRHLPFKPKYRDRDVLTVGTTTETFSQIVIIEEIARLFEHPELFPMFHG